MSCGRLRALERYAAETGERVTLNREARTRYLTFASGGAARWAGNFRDLSASVTRMATLAPAGRIDTATVAAEVVRLEALWGAGSTRAVDGLAAFLAARALAELGPFDRVQLAEVVRVCQQCRSQSEAGRILFAASRDRRSSTNDADRLRKYLARFDLTFAQLKA